ncbi:MAG: cell division ATP-binding protein FtsE [Deltaproteobacteria bacterium]|nr:cell division ATP-binding protein FtsE [Deltaproteobacteria bacterium]
MIQLFHVYKSYGREQPTLVDVSLRIEKGEFCFVTGPSGAGKTTLMRLLFAAERATQGQIIVNNVNLARLTERNIPYLRRSIGVVFQDFKLIANRTVFENVSVALEVLGTPSGEVRRRVVSMLKAVHLLHRSDHYPQQLSGGEQQRVAIARALINNPVLLLADEPTGNLDPEIAREVMDLFEEVSIRGTTVVIATHDRDLIQRLQKRVIGIERGRITAGAGLPD